MFSKRTIALRFLVAMAFIASFAAGDRPSYVKCFLLDTPKKCSKRKAACNWVASEGKNGRCRGKMCGRFTGEKTCEDFGCAWDDTDSTCNRRACSTYSRDRAQCEYFRCIWDQDSLVCNQPKPPPP